MWIFDSFYVDIISHVPGRIVIYNYISIDTVLFNMSLSFQGFLPAFVRLGPHTILTFMFLEQIRMNFGDDPKDS